MNEERLGEGLTPSEMMMLQVFRAALGLPNITALTRAHYDEAVVMVAGLRERASRRREDLRLPSGLRLDGDMPVRTLTPPQQLTDDEVRRVRIMLELTKKGGDLFADEYAESSVYRLMTEQGLKAQFDTRQTATFGMSESRAIVSVDPASSPGPMAAVVEDRPARSWMKWFPPKDAVVDERTEDSHFPI